jgi:hypothetical protein
MDFGVRGVFSSTFGAVGLVTSESTETKSVKGSAERNSRLFRSIVDSECWETFSMVGLVVCFWKSLHAITFQPVLLPYKRVCGLI